MKTVLLAAVVCLLSAMALPAQTSVATYVLYYSANSAELSDSAKVQLELLAATLKKDTTATIRIVGHCSGRGDSTQQHQLLSENRAQSCVKYLRLKGIAQRRIFPAALGVRSPVTADDTEKSRARNRRVEIKIIAP